MFAGLWPPDWDPEYDEAKETIPWPESETGYIRIKRGNFKKYVTEELGALFQIWRRVKAYGWPQGKGWLAEPEAVRVAVELLDAERETWLAWEKERNARGDNGRA